MIRKYFPKNLLECPQYQLESLIFSDLFDEDQEESSSSECQERTEDDWSTDDSFEGIIEVDDEPTGPSPLPTIFGDYPVNESSESNTYPQDTSVQVATISPLLSSALPESKLAEQITAYSPPSQKRKCRGKLSSCNVQDPVLQWKGVDLVDRNPNQLPSFLPLRTPGPQLSVRVTPYNILEIFMLYFPRDLVGKICQHMEDYVARRRASREIKYCLPKDFGPDMFYSFLACLTYIGLVRAPETEDYWSTSVISQLFMKDSPLSENDFHAILWAFHCTTAQEDKELKEKRRKNEPYDRLGKIRLLYDSIRRSCYEYRAPLQSVAVNTRTVACKSQRLSRKQCRKEKPAEWGIKFWDVTCAKTGYTHGFEIYTGKGHVERNETGLAYSVINSLMQPYLNCGHRVYMKEFFTSQELFEDFFAQNTLCVGTVQKNCEGYPKNVSNSLNNSSAQGEIRWLRWGLVCYVQWRDDQVVNMASTCHLGNAATSVFRYITTKTGESKRLDIPIPQCVYDHNRKMRGTDLSDQKIEESNCLKRINKWYVKLFFHFVDLAEINSLIIYNEMQEGLGRPTMSHKKSRMELIYLLQSMYIRSRASPNATSVILTPAQLLSHMSEWRKVRGCCYLCQMLDPRAPPRRTYHFCRDCNIALCNTSERNCYAKYHDNFFEPQ